MNNYWEKRAARQMHRQVQTVQDYLKDLAKYYIAASQSLQSAQREILRRFALTHHMSIKEAERLILSLQDPSSVKELIRALKKDPGNAAIVRELEAHSARARLMKLDTLHDQATKAITDIANTVQAGTTPMFQKLAKDAYYHAMFDAQQRAGFGFEVKQIDTKRIKSVMDRTWAGSSFSKRLWKNTKALERAVKQEVMVNLLTGRPLFQAEKRIAEAFNTGFNNARRLIRTESTYITNQMTLETYKDLDTEKYIYVAILDLRTSKICRSLDKKRFLVSQAQAGVNYPPMHPNCRSTTIAWMPDHLLHKLKQRAYDPSTGKYVIVPGDMTYDQWYRQFVMGMPPKPPTTHADRNLTMEQYRRYKARLGDVFPFTYDEFIKMKSTSEWAKWQNIYREAKE